MTSSSESAPTSDDFLHVTDLLQEPIQAMLQILARVQLTPELRPVDDLAHGLLTRLLTFQRGFEDELRDTAAFYERWRMLCDRLGRLPDRAIFAQLLEQGFADAGGDVHEHEPAPSVTPAFTPSTAPQPAALALTDTDEPAPPGVVSGRLPNEVRYWEAPSS